MVREINGPVVYVVATPIGNLDDMTLRAASILKSVDVVAAEDTRRAKQLLSHIGANKKEVISYFDHVEVEKAPQLIHKISSNNLSLALISDAGTPCVSDPGFRLIAAAHESGVRVIPVPGASALTALVSASGLPSSRFSFIGFLPPKDKAIKDEIGSWNSALISVVFYESTRRLKKTIGMIASLHPNCKICFGRELTKVYEEVVQLDIKDALDWSSHHENLKGEVAVMVSDLSDHREDSLSFSESLSDLIAQDIKDGKRTKEILKDRKDMGLGRPELYQLIVKLKSELSGSD
ncbi:MAG: 16S rRNA (cytidine(1402)-2'-O)-methyltransferase [Pseudobacteriovorax sp.]|nr:16S rRNA (cytidine(1402)-2'-O)-methyltransferase [Pseudobacteriovorax sp.]